MMIEACCGDCELDFKVLIEDGVLRTYVHCPLCGSNTCNITKIESE